MCTLLVDIHRLMNLHVTCYFTINQHKEMHYVQFGSTISPDYPYIVVFAFWISEYMAIAVESVEMGEGGGVD